MSKSNTHSYILFSLSKNNIGRIQEPWGTSHHYVKDETGPIVMQFYFPYRLKQKYLYSYVESQKNSTMN